MRSHNFIVSAAAASLLWMSACGTTQPDTLPLALSAPAALSNALADYRGDRTGVVWLRRHVKVKVATAVNPSNVHSVVELSALAANYGDAAAPVTLVFSRPKGVKLDSKSSAPTEVTEVPTAAVDPGSTAASVTVTVPPKGTYEFLARYQVPGTLQTDARWLGAQAAPTAELLLSYHVPKDAVGAFAVVGATGRPLVTQKGDYRIIALMLRNVPATKGSQSAYARYATKKAAPKGYVQYYASSWKHVLEPYVREFGPKSVKLRGGVRTPPVAPKTQGIEAVKELALWARNRIQRKDALDGAWDGGRPLPMIIPNNDLYAVDKVHLLHWLMDAAKIPHRIAVARSKRYPTLAADVPAPGVFDVALIYSDVGKLWLDPACQACEPGQVRESLRGRQVVLLPPGSPAIMTLP